MNYLKKLSTISKIRNKRIFLLMSMTLMVSVAISLVCLSTPVSAFTIFGDKDDDLNADVPVEVTADRLEYVKGDSKIIGHGNVVVTYKNVTLTCDDAEVYTDTKKANAKGHVVITRNRSSLAGNEVEYNFENNAGNMPDGTYQSEPYFGHGKELRQLSKEKSVLKDATITTCDSATVKHYDLKAKKVTIYTNDKIIATNVIVRVLGKPVFWLPFIHVPLNDRQAPFNIQPGHSSEFGSYVLGSKRYAINEDIKGKVNVDWRQKRGWGFGNDTNYDIHDLGTGLIKVYLTDDKNAPDQKFADPFDNRHNATRYRFTWKHKLDIDQYTTFQAEINKLSDKYLLQDFFEREYREEADPETFFLLTHNRQNFGIFANVEKRINHFVTSTEKLPEIRFNWNNQELFKTNTYYKNEVSLVHFNSKTAHSSFDTDVTRMDMFHELSYPKKLMNVSLKPFVNFRESYYSKNNMGEENLTRTVLGGGVDINTKFYKVFNAKTNFLGMDINGLRHIIEPSVQYNSIRSRNVRPNELFQNDVIDAIDDLDAFRFGLDNRVQTKRFIGGQERTVDIVSYNTYLTYEFNNETYSGSCFLLWNNEIELRPYTWLIMKFENTYDVQRDEVRESNFNLNFQKPGKWHIFVDQAFLKNDSKLLTLDGMYKINDKWGVGGYMRWEMDEQDTIEEWELRASRDLHCLYLDFGYNQRNSDINSANRELFFELSLKAFPEYPLKSGNHATVSRARIGETVAGSNQEAITQPTYGLIRY